MSYSTDSLIDTIRLRTGSPTADLVSNAAILNEINYALASVILPKIIEVSAEYYVTYEDFEITTAGIYNIPALAMGKKLRDVQVVGLHTTPSQRQPINTLPQLSLSNIQATFPTSYYYNQYGFMIVGNQVRIFPPDISISPGYLRMYYYRRPNTCVMVSAGSTITVTSSTTFTVPSVPAGWGATPRICVISQYPSFDVVEDCENILASVAGTTFTVADTSNMTTGDYVNLTGQTSYPQMPVDLSNILIEAVSIAIYKILRDQERVSLSVQSLQIMWADILKLITPRVDGKTIKIASSNNISNFI